MEDKYQTVTAAECRIVDWLNGLVTTTEPSRHDCRVILDQLNMWRRNSQEGEWLLKDAREKEVKLSETINVLSSRIDVLENSLEKAEQENHLLERENCDNDHLNSRVIILTAQVESFRDENATLRSRINDLQSEVDFMNREITHLEDIIEYNRKY